MTINLFDFQDTAVSNLFDATCSLLLNSNEANRYLVFQAPTGSGKTIMAGSLVARVSKTRAFGEVCFIWISIGKGNLHLQSAYSLDSALDGSVQVSLLDDFLTGANSEIPANNLLVVNWEKLNSRDSDDNWTNILMRDGENLNFANLLQNTRDLNRKIVLLVDESHYGANANAASALRELISADLTIYMSATPSFKPSAQEVVDKKGKLVTVPRESVIEAGLIKKEVIVNSQLEDLDYEDQSSQDLILQAGFNMQKFLEQKYRDLGLLINPLVLIQIPNADPGEVKLRQVEEYLLSVGIQYYSESNKSGTLLSLLSGNSRADILDTISRNDNPIRFIVFKQAIDTGWDCPRAQILIKLREIKSETFEIQTIGRILRMPERKHYLDDDLNRAYIFTNQQKFEVKEEKVNPNAIKDLHSRRLEIYEEMKLTSYYKSRADYGDITSSFISVFEAEMNLVFKTNVNSPYESNLDMFIKQGITIDTEKFSHAIPLDFTLKTVDFEDEIGEFIAPVQLNANLSEEDLRLYFEGLLRSFMAPFKNVKRSIPTIKAAIYTYFRKYLGSSNWANSTVVIQKTYAIENNSLLLNTLQSAISKYEKIKKMEVMERLQEHEVFYEYEIPEILYFNRNTHEVFDAKRYLHDKCFLERSRSNPEKIFEEFIDRDNRINWWWKNGDSLREFFGLKYFMDGVVHTFYPDYFVQTKNGSTLLLEVKSDTDPDGLLATKAKAEVLQKYLSELEPSLFSKFKGGIVIPRGKTLYCNDVAIYDWEKPLNGDWSEWKLLSDFLG